MAKSRATGISRDYLGNVSIAYPDMRRHEDRLLTSFDMSSRTSEVLHSPLTYGNN